MIYLNERCKKMLIESFSLETNTKVTLRDIFDSFVTILKEDSDIDNTSIRDRCSWCIGKILDSPEAVTTISQSEKFQSIFKNTEIRYEDGKLNLIVAGKEVSGNTKFVTTLFIISSYVMINNFETAGESIQKIGGAIIEKASELYGLELAKRCDLSAYQINGDFVRQVSAMVHAYMPLANILASLMGMVVISPSFSQTEQALLLTAIRVCKAPISASVGYIYTFVTKCQDVINIGSEILAKDILNQFAAIGLKTPKEK